VSVIDVREAGNLGDRVAQDLDVVGRGYRKGSRQ